MQIKDYTKLLKELKSSKYYNYKKFVEDNIKRIPFSLFGIKIVNDSFYFNSSKHIKKFDNCKEFERDLNKLEKFIYNGKRKINFHEFRQFPYISHGKENYEDISGLSANYTSSDIYLIKFIRKFMYCDKGKYMFLDIDFIIENSKRINIDEIPLALMPIDEIVR